MPWTSAGLFLPLHVLSRQGEVQDRHAQRRRNDNAELRIGFYLEQETLAYSVVFTVEQAGVTNEREPMADAEPLAVLV